MVGGEKMMMVYGGWSGRRMIHDKMVDDQGNGSVNEEVPVPLAPAAPAAFRVLDLSSRAGSTWVSATQRTGFRYTEDYQAKKYRPLCPVPVRQYHRQYL